MDYSGHLFPREGLGYHSFSEIRELSICENFTEHTRLFVTELGMFLCVVVKRDYLQTSSKLVSVVLKIIFLWMMDSVDNYLHIFSFFL